MKPETLQTLKNHLVSCLVGIVAGFAGVVAVGFGVSQLAVIGVCIGAVVLLNPWLKGWRFLSGLLGALLAGVVGAAVLHWLGVPIPAWV